MGAHTVALTGTRFPLLIKILDAQAKLSLQVHPPGEVDSVSGGIDHGTGSKDATTATSLQLLMPPTVKQDLRFLVITLHKVRGRAPAQ